MTFITSLLTTLIAILVFLVSGNLSNKRTSLAIRAIAFLIGVLAAIASLLRTLIIIPAGNVGVVELFGQVAERPLNPGIHLVNPFADVEEFSTRLRDIKETVEATSQEGLAFNIDVSVQYRLEPNKVVEVYKTIGTDETQIIQSRFRSIIREITASYPTEAIYSTKRSEVANQLRQRLTQQLTPLGFVIDEALLREIKLPETLQAAVQKKLAAEQESQQMKFTLEKERQEADRKRIEAQGISDSQKIISQGLNSQILQLKAIEATEKLANSTSTKVVVIGGGTGGSPLMLQLDSDSLSSKTQPKNQ
ncbi:MAG TPA: membrane protease subunit, stomatin/prohibitin [Cyanobacteria bacterium UBA11370]|nr:membrane protease subunit, stomatin/prohibitin [Cyanobacteria bacterium UBA11370]HBY81527.1 membrane protease subunit, stomatin/prohibitin [Cyanobacteria bacterium UBA11148]